MEWLQQYWQIVCVIFTQIGYQVKHNFRIENKVDKHIDNQLMENRNVRERLAHVEQLVERSTSALCQVHSAEIQHIHKRLDKVETTR